MAPIRFEAFVPSIRVLPYNLPMAPAAGTLANTAPANSPPTAVADPAIPPILIPLVEYLLALKGRADLHTLDQLLRATPISRDDLEPWCNFGTRGYKRNTIRRTEHFELLALTWRSGHCTPIHDHRGSSCAFRVVHGTGTEIRFHTTPSGLVLPSEHNAMNPGYVCAAHDDDIHQVANMQAPGEDLVTMHIYSPPIRRMRTYEFAKGQCDQAPDEDFAI